MELTRTPVKIDYGETLTGGLERRLASDGYVLATGFPDEFDYPAFLGRLGPLVPQYDGQLVWSIKADPKYDGVYHSLNTKELLPHTECYELAGDPPRHLALWCVTPSTDGMGQTLLADSHRFLETLTGAERDHLRTREFAFVSTPGLKSMELGATARHPVLEARDGESPIFRFTYHCLEHEDDPVVLSIRDRLIEFFEREHVTVDYDRGDLLVWDNHRVLHSRRGYVDRRRHLRRAWIG